MTTVGARVYGLGAVALGVVAAAYGSISPDWLPVPAHAPGGRLLVYGASAWLILGGALIQVRRIAPLAALGLAALFAAGMLVFEARHSLVKPLDWGGWQAVSESLAMGLGGVLAFANLTGARAGRAARTARMAFGACLLVFGGSHFVYAKLTASLVPAWLPPSQLSWAYLTGAAQIAAGLATLTGVWARRAAWALTAMYVVFSLLVHIPSVTAAPASQDNWTENAINLVLIGAAWSLAETAPSVKRRRETINRATPPRRRGNGATRAP